MDAQTVKWSNTYVANTVLLQETLPREVRQCLNVCSLVSVTELVVDNVSILRMAVYDTDLCDSAPL